MFMWRRVHNTYYSSQKCELEKKKQHKQDKQARDEEKKTLWAFTTWVLFAKLYVNILWLTIMNDFINFFCEGAVTTQSYQRYSVVLHSELNSNLNKNAAGRHFKHYK